MADLKPAPSIKTIDPLIQKAIDAFKEQFGRVPTHAAQSPGRVNLIGEHTDYNDGFVMPLALPMRTVIVASPNGKKNCRVYASDLDEMTSFVLEGLAPGTTSWANYIKGVMAQFIRNGHAFSPFDAVIVSDVPMGGGLSSSAALEVATATLIEQMERIVVSGVNKAKWSQAAEHEFAGMPCGIMDQFISAMGEEGHAMLLDCRSHKTRMVKLDDPDTLIMIANSNVKHELTGSEYPTRRAQCEAAVEALQKHLPKIKALRDVTPKQVDLIRTEVDEVIYRRARHVVGENERTLEAANALDSGDYQRAGVLMFESHYSLRDDFEVSTAELDALVEIAKGVEGVYGSRMTGGGFGGCTVSLLKKEAAEALTQAIQEQYPAKSGGKEASIYTVTPANGTRQIILSEVDTLDG